MGNKIADIKVGLPSRRMTKHTMDFSANLTMNFGEVNSLGFLEMDGNTKAKGSIKSLIRMSPLPLPTFGELSYKTYARFVPVKDIFRNFENLRGARSLTTSFSTFTPTSVPCVTIQDLSRYLLLAFCKYCIYNDPNEPAPEQITTDGSVKVEGLTPTTSGANLISAFNSYFNTSLAWGVTYINTSITPDNADFVVYLSSTQSPTYGGGLFCFRLTRLGKVLYRNLLSLGYKFDLQNSKFVSILPMLAFYKGYYDLFMPANTATANRNFTDTNCYHLCDYICENNVKDVFNYNNVVAPLFASFLSDLSQCFYYQDPDFITSMIASPSISPATTPPLSHYSNMSVTVGAYDSSTSLSNGQPTLSSFAPSSTNKNGLSALNIKLALRLLPYVNKDTIIGGKLRELIKSRFGYDVETLEGETYTAGRYNLPIQISALTNSADTAQGSGEDATGQVLGQQGGLGVAYTKDEYLRYNFKAKEYGFLMFYSVIVPKAGFFQGINPALNHGVNGRFSLYDPAFDSLGFDLYTKDILMGDNSVCCTPYSYDEHTYFPVLDFGTTAFGFSPRYFDYKNKAHSIVSGDLARLPYKDKFSAYYLDKYITPNTHSTELVSGSYNVTFVNNRVNIPTATPELRKIGYADWLENFNRIFYQYSLVNSYQHSQAFGADFAEVFGVDDNFVSDNVISCDYFDHSKPSSESFETDGEGKSMNVSHA